MEHVFKWFLDDRCHNRDILWNSLVLFFLSTEPRLFRTTLFSIYARNHKTNKDTVWTKLKSIIGNGYFYYQLNWTDYNKVHGWYIFSYKTIKLREICYNVATYYYFWFLLTAIKRQCVKWNVIFRAFVTTEDINLIKNWGYYYDFFFFFVLLIARIFSLFRYCDIKCQKNRKIFSCSIFLSLSVCVACFTSFISYLISIMQNKNDKNKLLLLKKKNQMKLEHTLRRRDMFQIPDTQIMCCFNNNNQRKVNNQIQFEIILISYFFFFVSSPAFVSSIHRVLIKYIGFFQAFFF